MIGILTPAAMRALDQAAIDDGTPVAELIERAAGEIARYLDTHVVPSGADPRTVVAVAGPGNNGADAIVAASMLGQMGWNAAALLVDRTDISEHPELEGHLQSLPVVAAIHAADVILDGIFGNSGRTELPASVTAALQLIRASALASSALVVALDCPTGTDTLSGEVADGIVSADITLCISHPKIGMLRPPASEHIGELIILDIGLDPAAVDPEVNARMLDAAFVRQTLPRRKAGSHKSQVGGLLVVGGAPGYYGAPRLAGEAALRAGCGYVGLAVPRSIVGAIASAVPELIYHPLSDSDGRNSATVVSKALSEGSRYAAIVLGPGLGRDEVATRFLSELLEASGEQESDAPVSSAFGIPRRAQSQEAGERVDISAFPLVLDADALNWLAGLDDWQARLTGRTCVLTPHVGEMARLLGVESDEVAADPWAVAREAAQAWGQVVVLKCHLSCVATPDGELFAAPRLTPEMATPGSGDVLAGTVGAFLAQGLAPADAAAVALYAGAVAGGNARLKHGTRAVIARDLIDALGTALKTFDSPVVRRFTTLQ